jgi:hypothetical protein
MRASALSAGRQRAYFAVDGIGGPRTIRGTQTEGRIMSKLEGKVAVISGGNSGIGLAIARRFVKEGAHVSIFGRRWDALDKAVSSSAPTSPPSRRTALRDHVATS